MKIGVDLDGVVCDLMSAWLTRYNDAYKDNLKPEDITDWHIDRLVKPECGKNIYKLLDESVYEEIAPIPGAIETFRDMNKRFDVYIVTASNPYVIKGKWLWIERNLPFLKREQVIVTSAKHMVRVNYLIDDCYSNVMMAAGKKIFPLLYTAPHNKHFESPEKFSQKRYERVNNWKEIREFFRF